MRSVGVCVLLIIMDGPGEKRLAGGPFEPIFAIGVADRGNSCQLGDAP
jgi:hypothetical protein